MIKRIFSFALMLLMAMSMSACNFFYKEKVVEKKPQKKITTLKELQDDSIKREKQLQNKIDEIVKKEEVKTKEQPQPIADNIAEKEIVNKYKTQLTKLQGYYSGQINSAIGGAKSELYSLPEDQRDTMAKLDIGLKYYKKIRGYENQCDAKVNSILSNMEIELNKYGYNTTIVGVIKNYYDQEKAARKSYYLSKMR